jgi:Ca2+-binding EF-hand superfamily protein
MNVLVRLLEPEDIEHLRAQFYAIDKDKTGLIKPEELMAAMKKMNLELQAEEIKQIINEVDYHDNKMINYSEFLAATISA